MYLKKQSNDDFRHCNYDTEKKSWLIFVLPEPNVTLEDNVDLLLVFRLHGEEKSIEAILKG